MYTYTSCFQHVVLSSASDTGFGAQIISYHLSSNASYYGSRTSWSAVPLDPTSWQSNDFRWHSNFKDVIARTCGKAWMSLIILCIIPLLNFMQSYCFHTLTTRWDIGIMNRDTFIHFIVWIKFLNGRVVNCNKMIKYNLKYPNEDWRIAWLGFKLRRFISKKKNNGWSRR